MPDMGLINELNAIKARIEALEAENAQLRGRVAKLEQRKK